LAICYDAPNVIICKSKDRDRSECGLAQATETPRLVLLPIWWHLVFRCRSWSEGVNEVGKFG